MLEENRYPAKPYRKWQENPEPENRGSAPKSNRGYTAPDEP